MQRIKEWLKIYPIGKEIQHKIKKNLNNFKIKKGKQKLVENH